MNKFNRESSIELTKANNPVAPQLVTGKRELKS